jgi:hypothetical protein
MKVVILIVYDYLCLLNMLNASFTFLKLWIVKLLTCFILFSKLRIAKPFSKTVVSFFILKALKF